MTDDSTGKYRSDPGAQGHAGMGNYEPDSDMVRSGASAEVPQDDLDPAELKLADGDVLDLSADEVTREVDVLLTTLEHELVGLTNVKLRVREISSLLLVDRARQQFGLASSRPTLHMSFTGGPGTGKITVAQRMAHVLHVLGYISVPKVHTVTREDLVGQFIGHTARKTKEAIAKSVGGVLFIGQSYHLFRPENERDYGQEAIEILLQEMERKRGSLVVIFAGYPNRMSAFFSANPGLSSRVAHHISFEDFDHGELVQIAELMLTAENFRLADEAREAFSTYLELRMQQPRFANARSVRNAVERCRLRQAKRLVELKRPLARDDLVTLTSEDIFGSSVFGTTPS